MNPTNDAAGFPPPFEPPAEVPAKSASSAEAPAMLPAAPTNAVLVTPPVPPIPTQPPAGPPPGYPFYPGYAGYTYPAMPFFSPAPAEKIHAAPSGRHMPLVWTIALVALAALAIGISFLGSATATLIPPPSGAPLYSSTLAQDDGAWQLRNDTYGACAFQANVLHAEAPLGSGLTELCALRTVSLSDVRVSVRVLPGSSSLAAAVFARDSLAVIFQSSGAWELIDLASQQPLQNGVAANWRENSDAGNLIDVIIQGTTYTLGVNGVQEFSGDLTPLEMGSVVPAGGLVGLSSFGTRLSDGVADYVDFQVGAP